ncbi:LacI family DNA-binding transcriptional regulator, partial [bacterium]|nr:LacI family DNA-binding transcriptional regulator [bacterium]
TVVSQPIEDIGNMTVKVMVERINNPTSRMKKIELKTKFIIRNSVRNLRNDLYSNTDNVY